ncbi:MAG: right-handed parallel beta-helix repeat-containing protein [Phycisphaerae bacterium]|nr:right-handed parallel beta-helix repeat-containing protein [Phycisphaerae bacterium]
MTSTPAFLGFFTLITSCSLAPQATSPGAGPKTTPGEPPLVMVDRDDIVVTESCRLVFAAKPIADLNGNGVVQVTGSGITVDMSGTTLLGADSSTPPDAFGGTGIVVTGSKVVLTNGTVRGFRCGVLAQGSNGSTFDSLTLSDNYATRLLSTKNAENAVDWLWPHENDAREWVTRYGAGLCVERASAVTIRDVTVRRTQNGIILDRVQKSRVYDNDCSFLSGWGLAMWRSSDNVIAKNAFDFCIRGYSHGVYNRGQDSAGILMFEQCSNNTIALNSATHGGDGLFGFAGKEALGERLPDGETAAFNKGKGCNNNTIIGNDFSFAAAHGLEMTFSFKNVIARNRFESNAICGIWGGYSRDTTIAFNTFAENGSAAKRAGEGGAIDIEHGARNVIDSNEFSDEGVAIELWWDDDKGLLETPWALQNGAGSEDSIIARNTFTRCGTAIGLRDTAGTIEFMNSLVETPKLLESDDASVTKGAPPKPSPPPTVATREELAAKLPGLKSPIGERASIGGREAIRMTAFGPWDGEGTLLVLDAATPDTATWQLFGATEVKGVDVLGGGSLRVHTGEEAGEYRVASEQASGVMPYLIRVRHDGKASVGAGCILVADWNVAFFPSVVDPRTDHATWLEGATGADSVSVVVPAIDFRFGNDGPSSLKLRDIAAETMKNAKLPADGFGTVAKATVKFPKGTFTFRVTSDDGVRVTIDGQVLIEDWTWHPPREARATYTLEAPREVEIMVEHFELDGFATLSLYIDGEVDAKRRAVFGQ